MALTFTKSIIKNYWTTETKTNAANMPHGSLLKLSPIIKRYNAMVCTASELSWTVVFTQVRF